MSFAEQLSATEAVQQEFVQTLDDSPLTYADIYERYLSSPLGAYHAAQPPRYANVYPYDHGQMHDDLGADVHPVEHGRYTHDDILVHLLNAQAMTNKPMQQFSVAEILAAKLAAHLHDFGECAHPDMKQVVADPPGDIDYHSKLPEHAVAEAAIRAHQRQLLFPEIHDDIWEASEAVIVGTDGSFVSHAFDAVEHVGYYITGLRAGYLALVEYRKREGGEAERDDLSYAQLRWLGVLVSNDHRTRTLPVKTEGLVYPAYVLRHSTEMYDKVQRVLAPLVEAEIQTVNA